VKLAHQAVPQALQALLERLVQLEPLVLAQAVQQAPQAFKGLLGSQEHLAQQAHKGRRALLEPPALTEPREPRGLQAPLAPLAYKAQQASEPREPRELQARVSRALLELPE
jgi:hypothetical protein